MASTLNYTPVYPLAVTTRPKWQGRAMPEKDGIDQEKVVGLYQFEIEYSVRFLEKNQSADLLDRFLADRDRENEWFYWTPPNETTKTFICKEWVKSRKNCVWSEVSATFELIYL